MANVPEDKARATAVAVVTTSTTNYPKSEELATKTDLKVELKGLELRLIKWMVCVAVAIIGVNIAIATAAFLASLIK